MKVIEAAGILLYLLVFAGYVAYAAGYVEGRRTAPPADTPPSITMHGFKGSFEP